jgi:carbon-monoxide dehydrogenase medium subunit
MKPPAFDYVVPESLEEALQAARQGGSDAKFLAGGQSLVPAMNFRIAAPALLIDLNRLPGLADVRREADGLHLGAMTRQRTLEFDRGVAEAAPLLAEAVPFIAHPQIRNRGTVGGSLVHADPAAELPVLAVALGARLRARSIDGERWIPADEFFQGMFTTAMAPEEMLVEVVIPPRAERSGSCFLEFSRRRGDYALMGLAAVVRLDSSGACLEARLVYLNAGDGPTSAPQAAAMLAGRRIDAAAAESAAAFAAEKEIAPTGNLHASPAFQRHLARVLGRRAILTAAQRAVGEDGP